MNNIFPSLILKVYKFDLKEEDVAMDQLTFCIVDVFAEEKYQGNQLAVFYNCENLTQEDMQKIAKETNFSETTFIISRDKINGGYDVRIFTPEFEVPFAGHPTLGTAYVIHREFENSMPQKIVLNLGVGQIPVMFGQDEYLWMKQKQPQFGRAVDAGTVAEILGISSSWIDTGFPIQDVSTGLPSVIIPLKSLEAVRSCRINHEKFISFKSREFSSNLLVFCKDTYKNENDLNVRVFAEEAGFPEDAATGSANGNLAGYLLKYAFFKKEHIEYSVEQGFEIGRPSILKVKAGLTGNEFDINVGGRVFPVAKGEWYL